MKEDNKKQVDDKVFKELSESIKRNVESIESYRNKGFLQFLYEQFVK